MLMRFQNGIFSSSVVILLFVALHSTSSIAIRPLLASKTIAVLGGGSVGSTLAAALAASGEAKRVVIAARDPDKTRAALAEKGLSSSIQVEHVDTALVSADVIILATPSASSDEAIEAIAKSLGDTNVAGKCIMDATNPLTTFQNGLEVRWSQGTSGGEVLQSYLPSAFVYKAFNTCGVEHMSSASGKDMLFCGTQTNKDALALASAVIGAVGFNPYYVGPIRYARNLEAMAELWIHCAIPPLPGAQLGRDWTFAIAGNPEAE
jgi:8-hydroxy-5-deazaflavin:NADPH oxidoreductase